MQESVKRIVNNLKTVILQWTVRTMVDCSNAALGLKSAVSENHKRSILGVIKLLVMSVDFVVHYQYVLLKLGLFSRTTLFSQENL